MINNFDINSPKKKDSVKKVNISNIYIDNGENYLLTKIKNNTLGIKTKKIITKRKITIPYSPKLLTKYRNRPLLYKGYQEEELENSEKQKIHANPLNKKIFQKTYGIPKCKRKLLTIPHSPNLTKKKIKYSIQSIKDSSYYYYDNLNDSLNKSSYSIPYDNKNLLKPIISKKYVNNKLSLSIIPFHLPGDVISKKKKEEFKEKIQKEEEESERLRQFIANPIPNKNVKNKETNKLAMPIPLVQPIPFNLITEKRGKEYQEIFKNNIKKQQIEEDKLRNFVAKPPISLFKVPFTILKSNKPLTEFKDIKFKTEIRAEEWVKYEKHLKEKNKEIEKIKKEQEEYKMSCEKQWIKEQRKKTIIYANPLPPYIYNSKKSI